MPLSKAQAVALSAELGAIAVRIRKLEETYALEKDSVGACHACAGLGVALLAALRSHAHEPEVLENAARSGLVLAPAKPPVTDAPLAFAKYSLEVSTANTPSSQGSDVSTEYSPSSPGSPTDAFAPSSPGSPTDAFAGNEIMIEPKNKTWFDQWPKRRVKHVPGMTIADLRRQFGKIRNLPVARVRAEGKLFDRLDDDQPVEKAAFLWIGGLIDPRIDQEPLLSQARAHAFIKDFNASLETISCEERKAHLPDIQTKIMGKHGIPNTPAGHLEVIRSHEKWCQECHEHRLQIDYFKLLTGQDPCSYSVRFGF